MLRSRVCLALAASAVALIASTAVPAQVVKLCNGALAVDSVFNTKSSNGRTARIDYFAQIRNTTNTKQTVLARFTYPNSSRAVITDRLNSTQTLSPYQSIRIKLGSHAVDNPSGAGELNRTELSSSLLVTCH